VTLAPELTVVVVTGFGPFEGVDDNPSGALARAIDGRRAAGETVVGRVLPVSFHRGPEQTLEIAHLLQPRLVLGLGVAMQRTRVQVEWVARCEVGDRPDVDGERPESLDGPAEVRSTLDVRALARAMGVGTSGDAGAYVCNAWLYRVASGLDVPVGFVHLPPEGLDPERLLAGLAALL